MSLYNLEGSKSMKNIGRFIFVELITDFFLGLFLFLLFWLLDRGFRLLYDKVPQYVSLNISGMSCDYSNGNNSISYVLDLNDDNIILEPVKNLYYQTNMTHRKVHIT